MNSEKINQHKTALLLQYGNIADIWMAVINKELTLRSKYVRYVIEELLMDDLSDHNFNIFRSYLMKRIHSNTKKLYSIFEYDLFARRVERLRSVVFNQAGLEFCIKNPSDAVENEKFYLLLFYINLRDILERLEYDNVPIRKHTMEAIKELMASESKMALWYTKNILKRQRFKLGEPAISKCSGDSLEYARIIGERFELGESVIAADPYRAINYAHEFMGGRWPEAEKAIASSVYAYWYARDMIKGRWKEGEKAIAESDLDSYNYAVNVLKERFPLVEQNSDFINSHHFSKYCRHFKLKMAVDKKGNVIGIEE